VLGNHWNPDPQRRYYSVDVLEPLVLTFRRIFAAIIDDLPRAFVLEPDDPYNKNRLILPETAIREILVNSLTHRDYRVVTTIQVIRYSDRIEVRNPGYSLASDEQFGEVGSFPRNPKLSNAFRDMGLAENKGTGISSVRRAMGEANLTPPIFDSDRSRNRFMATLWIHNLFCEDDVAWLKAIGTNRINDTQAKALVVARRLGTVSNATLRDISGLDTLGASTQLKKLREAGLLEARGSGNATHYLLSPKALETERTERTINSSSQEDYPLGADNRGVLEANRVVLEANRVVLEANRGVFNGLPDELIASIESLGAKPRKEALRKVILHLADVQAWRPAEMAELLGFTDSRKLVERHLAPMVREGILIRTHPDNLKHPDQAYRAAKTKDKDGG
jgi:ATP-dependent DNA helicase RecG